LIKIKDQKDKKDVLQEKQIDNKNQLLDNIIIGAEKNIPFKIASCCQPKK
jgi:(p)ppGpp synthase/HD superfamily hydrolase